MFSGRGQVFNLSSYDAGTSGCTGQFAYEPGWLIGWRCAGSGKHFKGHCLQGIAGKYRVCFAENLVRCRFSAAEVVVVHARQVVMYKGVGV
jgi:hypothetical protein